MHDQQMDQTMPNPDDLRPARRTLRDDPLRELLAPRRDEFEETFRLHRQLADACEEAVLPPDQVLVALELSVRQLLCLTQLLETLNAVGAVSEQRETALVFTLLPLIARLMRRNKYRSEEEDAFLLAFERSRTDDDQQLCRWYEGLTPFFYAMSCTDGFPGTHEYLLRTDAGDEVQDLLQEIAQLELQQKEAEDRATEEALEAKIAANRLKIDSMFHAACVRPEHVKSLIDAVEVYFSFREFSLAAYADLVNDLHQLFDVRFTGGRDAQVEHAQYRHIPFFTREGKIDTLTARSEDVASLLERDYAALLHVFLLARDGVLQGVRWYGNFPHSVEDKNLETRLKKILRPLTAMTAGLVTQPGYDPCDAFRFVTQFSYLHNGGHDFSGAAAFCDFTSENLGALHGALAAQLLTLQHFFAASREEARRIARDVFRGMGANESFRRDALQLIEEMRTMVVQRPGDVAATFLDKEIAGAVKSRLHTVALVLSLTAICRDKALLVKVKNRIPHLRVLLEKPAKLGQGALPGMLMPYITHTVKTLGVSLDDYYGNSALVTEVRWVVDQFFELQQHPALLEGRTPDQVIINGILTYGDYGVGKTFLMQCVEGEYGFRTFPISTEIFTREKNAPLLSYDELVAYAEPVFSRAMEASRANPVLLTIDELCEFAADRLAYPGKETVTNYFLRKIEEIRKGYPGIFLMANSNYFHQLDPGVKRPGRFDIRRSIESMDKASIEQLIDATLLLETQTGFQPDELSMLADAAMGLTPFATIQAIANYCRLQQAHGEVEIPEVAQLVRALERMQDLQHTVKKQPATL